MAYQKILAPLDGSELAEKALPYAKTIAEVKDSEVVLFAVSVTARGTRRARLLETYMDVKAKNFKTKGMKVSTAVAYGDVAEEIIEYADKNKVDLIIISTHGYSGIKRWMLGSVTQKVLYGTPTPILLIKSKSPEIPNVKFKKILLPVDGSPFSEATFPYVEELAKNTKAEVILIEVSESPIVPSYGDRPINPTWNKYRDTLWVELQQHTSEYLEKIKDDLVKRGIKVKSQAVKGNAGETANKIMQSANKENVDLVVIATHGRTGISRWVYGSVANSIVQESIQPVMLIRPTKPK